MANHCGQLEVLYRIDRGYVARCQCGNYHVEYGNMLIQLPSKRFKAFMEFVHLLKKEEMPKYLMPITKKLVIQPTGRHGSYAFSIEEFAELKELIEGTKAILAIEKELKEYIH